MPNVRRVIVAPRRNHVGTALATTHDINLLTNKSAALAIGYFCYRQPAGANSPEVVTCVVLPTGLLGRPERQMQSRQPNQENLPRYHPRKP